LIIFIAQFNLPEDGDKVRSSHASHDLSQSYFPQTLTQKPLSYLTLFQTALHVTGSEKTSMFIKHDRAYSQTIKNSFFIVIAITKHCLPHNHTLVVFILTKNGSLSF